MNKVIKWAICCIRNEFEDIIGSAKIHQYFAENVIYVLDPTTTDQTENMIKCYTPQCKIIYQDRTLGDSDDSIQGKKKVLIAHKNLELVINKYVQDGEWVLMMAPDERFAAEDLPNIKAMVNFVKTTKYKGITFPSIHNPTPHDITQAYDYYSKFTFGGLIQLKFLKKEGFWAKGGPPHSGYTLPDPVYTSPYPLYHFNWQKKTRKAFQTWRDQKQYQNLPTFSLPLRFEAWRTMPELTFQGELK